MNMGMLKLCVWSVLLGNLLLYCTRILIRNDRSDNLWICLICAHVGCGRYQKGHARTHFEETGHVYSLELVTQRVWDYKGDGYDFNLLYHLSNAAVVVIVVDMYIELFKTQMAS